MCPKIEAITILCCEYWVPSPLFKKIGVLYLGILHNLWSISFCWIDFFCVFWLYLKATIISVYLFLLILASSKFNWMLFLLEM